MTGWWLTYDFFSHDFPWWVISMNAGLPNPQAAQDTDHSLAQDVTRHIWWPGDHWWWKNKMINRELVDKQTIYVLGFIGDHWWWHGTKQNKAGGSQWPKKLFESLFMIEARGKLNRRESRLNRDIYIYTYTYTYDVYIYIISYIYILFIIIITIVMIIKIIL